jgi:predicted enzyme related to lactoylglutathione lyase
MFLGLRTVIYPATDLAAAKEWYTRILGFGPYFDEPFYVGFEVGGYELGLFGHDGPGDPPPAVAYWGVPDADAAVAALEAAGATTVEPVTEVGGGIRVATVAPPVGAVVGVIENPHFRLPDAAAPTSS